MLPTAHACLVMAEVGQAFGSGGGGGGDRPRRRPWAAVPWGVAAAAAARIFRSAFGPPQGHLQR